MSWRASPRGGTRPSGTRTGRRGARHTEAARELPEANGVPAAYPSGYAGCHYGTCSAGGGLPVQVGAFENPRSTVSYRTTGGSWDAA
ncbi:hypothetical protein ACIP5U_09725 [Streptomyces sp. NPDC088788]|uniref:hypothetical protein n=1 Tax=Streptomyces sp. NPDC088788 TaxID=3365898 RepID=UPI0037FBC4F2